MASVNKVILVGNLGRDPEMRSFSNGDEVANVTIACTDRWKDKNTGEQKEATEWVRLVFNGPLAKIVGQHLRKGSQVYVEGSLRTRKWTDQATGQERYATEVRADVMQMLGSKGGGQEGGGQQQRSAPAPAQNQQRQAAPAQRQAAPAQRSASGFDDLDDDSNIPF